MAGRALGLKEPTAQRQRDALLAAVPAAADRLIAEIEAAGARRSHGGEPAEAARAYLPGELRLLRAIRHVVIADMVKRLA